MVKPILVIFFLISSFLFSSNAWADSQYCGPSTCVMTIPDLILAPNQPNPVYQNYPQVEKYWMVQPNSQSTYSSVGSAQVYTYSPSSNSQSAPLSNADLMRGIKRVIPSAIGSSPSFNFKSRYNYSNNGSAPLSNYQLMKMFK